ncbi:MAG: hypothetical protein MJ058_04115 [Akkermansia sp.]|nr:hypothetical protein [Akkermansia sp.]
MRTPRKFKESSGSALETDLVVSPFAGGYMDDDSRTQIGASFRRTSMRFTARHPDGGREYRAFPIPDDQYPAPEGWTWTSAMGGTAMARTRVAWRDAVWDRTTEKNVGGRHITLYYLETDPGKPSQPVMKGIYRRDGDGNYHCRRYDRAWKKSGHGFVMAWRLRSAYVLDSARTVQTSRLYYYNDRMDWHRATGRTVWKRTGGGFGTGSTFVTFPLSVRPYDQNVRRTIMGGRIPSSAQHDCEATLNSVRADMYDAETRPLRTKTVFGTIQRSLYSCVYDRGYGTNRETVFGDTPSCILYRHRYVEGEGGEPVSTTKRTYSGRATNPLTSVVVNGPGASRWPEGEETCRVAYARNPDGTLASRVCTLLHPEDPDASEEIQMSRAYSYEDGALGKVLAVASSGIWDGRKEKDVAYIRDDRKRVVDRESVFANRVYPDVEGVRVDPETRHMSVLAYIRSRLILMANLSASYPVKTSFGHLAKAVESIIAQQDTITPERVASIIENARRNISLWSGGISASQSLVYNLFMDSIVARYGAMPKAETQCAYLKLCTDAVTDETLRGSMGENADVAAWGIGGLSSPVSCEKGYVFDPSLVDAARLLCAQNLKDMVDNVELLQDARRAILEAISRAVPIRLSPVEDVTVRVVNLALARCGISRRISSMEEDSTEANTALTVLDQCMRNILASHPWGFAVTDVRLPTRKNVILEGGRWAFCARLPADCCFVEGIWNGERNGRIEMEHPFEVTRGRIFCDVENPSIRYYRSAALDEWPEPVLNALAWQVAAELCMPLTVKPDVATAIFRMAELELQRASAWDANGRRTDLPAPSKYALIHGRQ